MYTNDRMRRGCFSLAWSISLSVSLFLSGLCAVSTAGRETPDAGWLPSSAPALFVGYARSITRNSRSHPLVSFLVAAAATAATSKPPSARARKRELQTEIETSYSRAGPKSLGETENERPEGTTFSSGLQIRYFTILFIYTNLPLLFI